MRGLSGDRIIYELILYVYFSKERYHLAKRDVERIDEFMMLCKAKDKLDNTQVAETIAQFYSMSLGSPIRNMQSSLGLSGASLYRFRSKVVDILKDFLRAE